MAVSSADVDAWLAARATPTPGGTPDTIPSSTPEAVRARSRPYALPPDLEQGISPETAEYLGTPEGRAEFPLSSAAARVISGIPAMVGAFPGYGYRGAELAMGDPQTRAAVLAQVLRESGAQGQQIAQQLQSPVGSADWYEGMLNTGMMAVPPIGEMIGGLGEEARPPVQAAIPDAWLPARGLQPGGAPPGAPGAPPSSNLAPLSSLGPSSTTLISPSALAMGISGAGYEPVSGPVGPTAQRAPFLPPVPEMSVPPFYQPTISGPQYDPVAAAQYQQATAAQMQPLLAAEYQFKRNGQPVPPNLSAAIREGQKNLEQGFQQPPQTGVNYASPITSAGALSQLPLRPSMAQAPPLRPAVAQLAPVRESPMGVSQGTTIPPGDFPYAGITPASGPPGPPGPAQPGVTTPPEPGAVSSPEATARRA